MRNGKRGRYTLEFKQEAVRLVESGQRLAAAARSLGVPANSNRTGAFRASRFPISWTARLPLTSMSAKACLLSPIETQFSATPNIRSDSHEMPSTH